MHKRHIHARVSMYACTGRYGKRKSVADATHTHRHTRPDEGHLFAATSKGKRLVPSSSTRAHERLSEGGRECLVRALFRASALLRRGFTAVFAAAFAFAFAFTATVIIVVAALLIAFLVASRGRAIRVRHHHLLTCLVARV